MKRRDDPFILFFKDHYDQYKESNPCGIYCLSDSTVDMLLSCSRFADWPTRWRLNDSDRSSRMTGDSWLEVRGWGELATKELVTDMTCDLTEGLGLIADAIVTASNKGAISELAQAVNAIANKNFCCDNQTDIVVNVNGGVYGSTPDGTITYGTTPPIAPPTTIPEGYEDEAQYAAQKCAIAHGVVTGVVYTLDALTAVASVNAIAATIGIILAAVPIIPVSPVLIPVLVPLVATAWLASGVLHAASLMIEDNREELVCILLSGENIDIIFEQLAEALDIMIAAMSWSGPVALAVKSMILVLINADTLNQLYSEFAGIMYPSANCDFCDEVECPVALHFISEIATEELASLVRLAWSDSTLIGTTGTWGENCELRFLAEDLFPVVGSQFKAQYVRLRMTVYLPENANSEFYYGINDEWVTVLSGNNGTGPHTYEIDWTASVDELFENVFFYGNSLYREWQISNIKIDIPCESIIVGS